MFCGSEVMRFLLKYESLATITSTDPSSHDTVTIFPNYCVEGFNVPYTLVIIRGYM
jgi:hypothetical protein